MLNNMYIRAHIYTYIIHIYMFYMGIRTWLPPDADLTALFISSYPQNVYRINSYVHTVTAVCVC